VLRFEYHDRRPDGRVDRREVLRWGIGGLAGLLGTQAPGGAERRSAFGAAPVRRARGFGRAKAVILVYASGGQSQLDTWDPKPDAPLDVRGAFSTIQTPLAGVRLCEHLPKVAALTDRLAILRCLSHMDLDHGSATYLTLTGRYHRRRSSNPDPSPDDFPTYGAALKRVRTTGRFPYEAVHVNGPALVPQRLAPGQDGGILGRDFEPLMVGDVTAGRVALPGLEPQAALPPVRLSERQQLKVSLDAYRRQLAAEQQAVDLGGLYRRALGVLSSDRCRRAFDLEQEPDALRDRYGRHRSGQACLLARRLVEAGAPYVNVIWNHTNRGQDLRPDDPGAYGWDTHNDIFSALGDHLLPRFDESFATLIDDLDQRGLLDETLVVCMGEFGRAPRVALEPGFAGSSPGRKHWASVYSIVAAGAGVRPGNVVGASDRLGAEPAGERYGPWDVAATMYSALGIDPDRHYTDRLGRPFPLTVGRPIEALYA